MATQYNTIVEMFSGCPFDNTYSHTLEAMPFQNKLSWLENNCRYDREHDRFENLMKVRIDSGTNRGTVKLECNDIDAYYYNYAYVNNLSGASFFCFVSGCRYVNDASQPSAPLSKGIYEFDLELDLMMTNLLSPNQLRPCVVIRQHSTTDEIGDSLTGEPIATLELEENSGYTRFIPSNAGLDQSCIILYWIDPNQTDSKIIDGVVSGANVSVFPSTEAGLQSLNTVIQAHADNPSEIVGLAMGHCLYAGITTFGNITSKLTPTILTGSVPSLTGTETLNGYKPKNKKLYTFPYNYVSIVNSNGDEMILRYEFWNTTANTLRLQVASTLSSPIAYQLRPLNYKEIGSGSTAGRSVDTFIELNGLPIGTWRTDNYELWKAQSLASRPLDYAKAGIGAIVTGATTAMLGGNPLVMGGVALGGGILNTVTSHLEQRYEHSLDKERLRGSASGSAVNFNTDTFGFFYARKSVIAENAKMIDDYFTRFGYSQGKIMKPDTAARPYFTFVKTGDDTFINSDNTAGVAAGQANAQQITQINSIFKSGVTFWSRNITMDNIFKYDELDNSPS